MSDFCQVHETNIYSSTKIRLFMEFSYILWFQRFNKFIIWVSIKQLSLTTIWPKTQFITKNPKPIIREVGRSLHNQVHNGPKTVLRVQHQPSLKNIQKLLSMRFNNPKINTAFKSNVKNKKPYKSSLKKNGRVLFY